MSRRGTIMIEPLNIKEISDNLSDEDKIRFAKLGGASQLKGKYE